MRARLLLVLGLAAASVAGSSVAADGGRLPVTPFATLPADARHPESLDVDPATGEVYVGTFDARTPESARNNQLLRLAADGRLLAQRRFGPTPLTGVAFHDGHVYVLNFGASKLQRLSARFDADSAIEDVAIFASLSPAAPPARRIDNPDGSHDTITFGSQGFPAINGMAFDRAGTLYVSDSFQGAVYRIANAATCRPCTVEVFARDPLLATTGALPFGANGMAFNTDESVLYINNAGDGRVLRKRMPDGVIEVLADGVYGADGLLFHAGLLWVSANQIDTLVALDERGRVRHRAGDFLGVDDQGAPRGLLFPAASAVQGRRMIVANLALPLTAVAGDEWEEDVTRWNLMQFDLPDPPPPAH
ncbi:SMP-30/gluconolactonase/LRE family protein [Pseudoxanthomonas mexicana]